MATSSTARPIPNLRRPSSHDGLTTVDYIGIGCSGAIVVILLCYCCTKGPIHRTSRKKRRLDQEDPKEEPLLQRNASFHIPISRPHGDYENDYTTSGGERNFDENSLSATNFSERSISDYNPGTYSPPSSSMSHWIAFSKSDDASHFTSEIIDELVAIGVPRAKCFTHSLGGDDSTPQNNLYWQSAVDDAFVAPCIIGPLYLKSASRVSEWHSAVEKRITVATADPAKLTANLPRTNHNSAILNFVTTPGNVVECFEQSVKKKTAKDVAELIIGKIPMSISQIKLESSLKNARVDMLFKLIITGDSGSGKTCLLRRFAIGDFEESLSQSIGIDFRTKNIQVHDPDKVIKLQIWDTAGQERFASQSATHYRNTQGVIITFDVTSTKSFKSVDMWLKLIAPKTDAPVVLVATKCDLHAKRVIHQSEARQYAISHNMEYFESSAMTGHGVNDIFQNMARDIWQSNKDEFLETLQSLKDNLQERNQQSNCSIM